MNIVYEIFHNKYILVPFFTWFAIQSFKVIWEFITTKKFNIKRFMGAGGMPSSHSALVTSIAVMIGKEAGFGSYQFALSMIFALIVMYDAAGIRRAAGNQATVLNKIIHTPGLIGINAPEKLKEALGHTPNQVFVGAIIGIIVGAIF